MSKVNEQKEQDGQQQVVVVLNQKDDRKEAWFPRTRMVLGEFTGLRPIGKAIGTQRRNVAESGQRMKGYFGAMKTLTTAPPSEKFTSEQLMKRAVQYWSLAVIFACIAVINGAGAFSSMTAGTSGAAYYISGGSVALSLFVPPFFLSVLGVASYLHARGLDEHEQEATDEQD